MNLYGIRAIYIFEMRRFFKTLGQSILSPVLSTTLYFVVFGSAIGSAMVEIDGISYGAFIIPGLIMLTLLGQSISNASFGIYFPRFTGTIYEILSAPLSPIEIVTGYVGAAATKSIFIGILILITARFFVDYDIQHPLWMFGFLVLTSVTFSLLGFLIGIWAEGFEKLQIVPLMVITPLAFLGGMTGQLYKQFAVTIAISVVFSGLVALTLSPALAALLIKPGHGEKHGFFKWFERVLERATNGYVSGAR